MVDNDRYTTMLMRKTIGNDTYKNCIQNKKVGINYAFQQEMDTDEVKVNIMAKMEMEK